MKAFKKAPVRSKKKVWPIPRSYSFSTPKVDLARSRIEWLLDSICPAEQPEQLLNLIVAARHRGIPADRRFLKAPAKLALANPLRGHPDCQSARQRIHEAFDREQTVLIFGDYDCDGVTSVTIMRDALIALGFHHSRVRVLIPDRMHDGYGLKQAVLERHFSKLQARRNRLPHLVIAVDCGTSSVDAISYLSQRKIDIIIVDHHLPDESVKMPAAAKAVRLNPKLWLKGQEADRAVKIKDLCAAGLTFLLAEALLDDTPQRPGWLRERALLLAGMATCVDVVPLLGLNRKLLQASLQLANKKKKLALVPGLVELKRRVGPQEKHRHQIKAETYGFYWGPALNAPGRMASAMDAVHLLASATPAHARLWAGKCVRLNKWRKAVEITIVESARRDAERACQMRNPSVLLLCGADWHPGVLGIAAARIKDQFYRPAILCSRSPDGLWRGSGRSIRGYDLGATFHVLKGGLIQEGGGHAMAGGLSFPNAMLPSLRNYMDSPHDFPTQLLTPTIEDAVHAASLSPSHWASVFRQLSPLGQGNRAPVLIVAAAELLGVRVRTRVDRDKKEEARLKGLEAARNVEKSGKTDAAKSKMAADVTTKIWCYEGIFLDRITGKTFFAQWLDVELAEYFWQVERFLAMSSSSGKIFTLPYWFRLHLELRAFVPSHQWPAARAGRKFEWDYSFQIRDCVPIRKKNRPSSGPRSVNYAATFDQPPSAEASLMVGI